MEHEFAVEFSGVAVVIVFGVIGYLLSRRDDRQERDRIEDKSGNDKMHIAIFKRLDEGRLDTENLKIEMAVVKQTNLNTDKMLTGLNIGFEKLGDKIDNMRTELTTDIKCLNKSLDDHISHHGGDR
jgi:hypothetical protein